MKKNPQETHFLQICIQNLQEKFY